MKKYLILAYLLMLLASCGSGKDSELTIYDPILGTFNGVWESHYVYNSGVPCEAHITLTCFTDDNKVGIYIEHTANGEETFLVPYKTYFKSDSIYVEIKSTVFHMFHSDSLQKIIDGDNFTIFYPFNKIYRVRD